MNKSLMKRVITVILVLFFILMPILAIPVNIYSAPDNKILNGYSLLEGLLSLGPPIAEGFSYWKNEYPSTIDWFASEHRRLNRPQYHATWTNGRSAIANIDLTTGIYVTALDDYQANEIVRVVPSNGLQQVEVSAASAGSTDKPDNGYLFKLDYVLLAFGLIGYIVIRRRANI
jgi:hypothetical protein